MSQAFVRACLVTVITVYSSTAMATFHLMQIEQVVGGVNGDLTAQAIQLRSRSVLQNQVQNARLVVYDATGSNPIILATFPGPVAFGATGRRVLIVSSNFNQYTSPGVVADQTMTNLIPASYLAAGSLTFEDIAANVVNWRISWGGAAYTGPTTGTLNNDADGNFGPPVAGALPSTTLQALRFSGAASSASTNNLADYALTVGAAVYTNNNNASFTATTPPCTPCNGDLNGDLLVNGADIAKFVSCFVANTPGVVGCPCADQDHNVSFDASDISGFVDLLLGVTSPTPPCS